MCLILLAYEAHPRYRLVVAANRDEFYGRPTAPAAFWADAPDVLAGRDLRAGGTWMGVTRGGRFAAVTNYRDAGTERPGAPSRGDLVSDFLRGEQAPPEYLRELAPRAVEYNGFNLLVGDAAELFYLSNRENGPRALAPGVYGLSNALLDTPWPKVEQGKRALAELLAERDGPSPEAIFRVLADRTSAEDSHLPNTGVGPELERILSPRFITSPRYGTRSSTVLLAGRTGEVVLAERTFTADPERPSEVAHRFTLIGPTAIPAATDDGGGRREVHPA